MMSVECLVLAVAVILICGLVAGVALCRFVWRTNGFFRKGDKDNEDT